MSNHDELIERLRASAAAMPFDAAVAVQYRAAADALEAQARKSSCCVMRVRRLVLRVSAMFTWPSVGLIGVT